MMQSYNNSVWNPPQNSARAGPSYRQQVNPPGPTHDILPRSLSAGPSAPPLPPLPPSLTPGGRHRGQSAGANTAGLFFEHRSDYGFPRRASDTSPLPEPLYSPPISRPRYSQSYTASTLYSQSQQQPAPPPPPLPRKPMNLSELSSSRPPIPPKLQAGYPSPPPSGLSHNVPFYARPSAGAIKSKEESSASQPPKPVELDDDNDLALALAVSASEVTERSQEFSNADDEDEQLVRALEESRLLAEVSTPAHRTPSVGLQIIPPDITSSWLPGMPMPEPSTSGVPKAMRALPPSPAPHPSSEAETNPVDNQFWLTSSPKKITTQLSDDEAFARRLAARYSEQSGSNQRSSSQENDSNEPPLYSPTVSGADNAPEPRPSYALSVSSGDSHPGATNDTPLLRESSFVSASSLDPARRYSDTQLASQVLTAPSSSGSPVARPATDTSNLTIPSSAMTTPGRIRTMSSMTSLSSLNLSVSDCSSGITANPFVEKELLYGVSIGFTPPTISSTPAPMSGPMPNIITLPFGKSPPLHLQAPSWRHLLKLMARLSGTRIEPTLEAVAVTKEDLKLRTVVQFIRVHHSALDWRVVLYFTIDYPVAANAPNAWKYTNGDVSTLPWSYTLSTLPTLLRDGADSELSTYYSIPSTPSTPHPTLPINFPNLAMYLQAALEDSRRAMHDSSSGIRKLAKCVDSFYANDRDVIDDDAEDGRRSNFFKKVIARVPGNKQKGGRGRNEEVYEFVTPFVPDEWGK